jgi:hypothetical protein
MCLTGQLRHTDACDKYGFLDVCCRACLTGTPQRPWHSGRGLWGIGLAKLVFGVDAKIVVESNAEAWRFGKYVSMISSQALSRNTPAEDRSDRSSQTPHTLRSTPTSGMCAQSHRSVPCGACECLRRDRKTIAAQCAV